MADYTYQELMRMQNDAIKRVEDMQRRARKTAGFSEENENSIKTSIKMQNENAEIKRDEPKRVRMPDDYLRNLKEYARNVSGESFSNNDIEYKETDPDTQRQNARSEQKNGKPSAKKSTDGLKGVLGDIKIDEDKALLLSLVLLLSEEKADETLILALLYMLS